MKAERPRFDSGLSICSQPMIRTTTKTKLDLGIGTNPQSDIIAFKHQEEK